MRQNGSGNKVSNCNKRGGRQFVQTKKYNTTEKHRTRIDKAVARQIFGAIEGVNHLTPASEAVMENCLLQESKKVTVLMKADIKRIAVPAIDEVIKRNSPGFESTPEPVFEQDCDDYDEEDTQKDWETEKGPTRAALRKIEAEEAAA